jgi:4-diphosphocytidyl-2-C-methyl-D-erythritol kinase
MSSGMTPGASGGSTWTGAAPAKVNLFLRVLAREEDGYHQIETLFQALELADRVELQLSDPAVGIQLELEGVEPGALGPPESNLAVRAARAFLERVSGGADPAGRPGIRIRLGKHIPHGAGLGGGSSDAATTLRGLNELLGSPLSHADLVALGGRLGADVAFFLCGSPLALAWGRGDRLLPLSPLPAAGVLVAVPPWGIPTPAAYAALARNRARSGTAPPAARCFTPDTAPWTSWEALVAEAENAFEAPIMGDHPELARIRRALEAAGGRPALLSGSGSAVFGIIPGPEVPSPERADRIMELAAVEGLRVLATRTCGVMAPDAEAEGLDPNPQR